MAIAAKPDALPRGMTLMELLVVITVIGVILMISLPAITSALESGRRVNCVANQTKLALAMSRMNASQDYLPGWRNNLTIVNVPGTVSWFVHLLPYLERKDVYDGVVNGTVWLHDGVVSSPHDLFSLTRCPSMPLQKQYRNYRMHYAANGGSSGPGASTPRDDGALGDNSAGMMISLDDIRSGDGLATTLLISETVWEFGWIPKGLTGQIPGVGGPVLPTTPGAILFNCPPNIWTLRIPTVADGVLGQGSNAFGFSNRGGAPTATTQVINVSGTYLSQIPSSRHPRGVVAIFADGSSRFLKDDLLPHIYGHLLTSRSVYDASGPAGQKYVTNSVLANTFLAAPSAPVPYQIKPTDF